MSFSIFHQIPLWADFVIFIVVLLITLELGWRVGVRQRAAWKDAEAGGGKIVLTSLFAVLGLMLAFSFNSGVSQHKARKRAVVEEANALGTAFLRAGLVAEPGRTELRNALRDYARTRTSDPRTTISTEELEQLLQETWDAKARLWPATEQILRESQAGPIEASLVVAVNNVMDSDTIRLAAIFDTLPSIVLLMLLFIAAATVAVAGFNAGLSGRMSRWRTTILVLVLAGIMLVILDFDRPNTGFIDVNEDAIRVVIAEMEDNFTP